MWRNAVLALALALLVSAPGARAQDGSGDAPSEPFGKPWSVPDSSTVVTLTTEIRKAVENANWEKVALKVQNLLDYHTSEVVLDGVPEDEHYIGVRVWAHRLLRSLPEPGFAAWRTLADPLARDLLARAERRRDPAALRELIRRFYLSESGPAALRALATLRLSEARYADAAWWLGRLRHDFDASPSDLARLAFAAVRAGDLGTASELIDGRKEIAAADATVRVKGEETTLGAFLAGLAPELERLREKRSEPDPDWPVFGGSDSRTRPAPAFSSAGPAEWSARTGWDTRDEDREIPEYRGRGAIEDWLVEDHYPVYPVADHGVLYFQNGFTVYARNLFTGNVLWSADGPIVRNDRGKTNAATVHSLAVADGVVYANLEVPAPIPPREASQFAGRTVIYYLPQRRLFAFEASTGRLLWSHEDGAKRPDEERDFLENLNENSPPIVVGDTVYIAAGRSDNRYFCYVLAVDAETGRIRWRTSVATGQQELNLFGRPIKELAPGALSVRDGHLYFASNLGVAASLDRRTGEIRWIRGYPQIPIPSSFRWYRAEEREPTWTNAPPVVTEDSVYLTPTDSEYLVALDRETGDLRFLFSGGRPREEPDWFRRLVGIGPDYVYVTGSRVAAIDRRSGKLVWGADRGSFEPRRPGEERESALGRGLVTPTAVWTATRRGLYAFDAKSGRRLSFEPHEPSEAAVGEGEGFGGNLLFGGNVLVVSGQHAIAAHYRKELLFERLKERARAAPGDPRVALELGEIYAKWSRYEDAIREYERARRLAAEDSGVATAANRGLFTIHMGLGEEARAAGRAEEAERHFRAARDAAVDDAGRIRARLGLTDAARLRGDTAAVGSTLESIERDLGDVVYEFPDEGAMPAGLYALLRLADLSLSAGRPGEAVARLQRIMERYPDRELADGTPSQDEARKRIAAILKAHGREVYAPFEKVAARRLEEARQANSPERFEEVVRLWPNSRAAESASVDLGRLLLERGAWREAAIVLRRMLVEFPDSDRTPTVLYLLSRALEARGYLVSTKSALLRLMEEHPDAEIEVDGSPVRAADYAKERLAEPQFAVLRSRVPRVELPLAPLWTLDEGGNSYVRVLEPEGTPPPGTEGDLLIGTNGLLQCLDATRKETLWQREMNGIVTRPVYAEGALVLVNSAAITAVNPDDGSEIWEMPVDASIRAVGASPGLVFVLTADFRDPAEVLLRAITPREGQVVWQRRFPRHQIYDLLLLTEEAVGVAARDPAGVTVLDAATGRPRFEVKMQPRSLYREPFLVDGNTLFVVHGNQRFELYEMPTGRLLWQSELPGDSYFRSAIPVSGGVLFTDTLENLMLLDAATGRLRWSIPPVEGAPLQYQGEAADADRVYVVRRRDADSVYFAEARDIRTGRVLWRTDLVTSKSATPTPLVTGAEVVYHLNSYDFDRTAWTSKSLFLDRKTGEIRQEIAPEALEGYFTYAVLRDGIYCLNARGKVAAYGPK